MAIREVRGGLVRWTLTAEEQDIDEPQSHIQHDQKNIKQSEGRGGTSLTPLQQQSQLEEDRFYLRQVDFMDKSALHRLALDLKIMIAYHEPLEAIRQRVKWQLQQPKNQQEQQGRHGKHADKRVDMPGKECPPQ